MMRRQHPRGENADQASAEHRNKGHHADEQAGAVDHQHPYRSREEGSPRPTRLAATISRQKGPRRSWRGSLGQVDVYVKVNYIPSAGGAGAGGPKSQEQDPLIDRRRSAQ